MNILEREVKIKSFARREKEEDESTSSIVTSIRDSEIQIDQESDFKGEINGEASRHIQSQLKAKTTSCDLLPEKSPEKAIELNKVIDESADLGSQKSIKLPKNVALDDGSSSARPKAEKLKVKAFSFEKPVVSIISDPTSQGKSMTPISKNQTGNLRISGVRFSGEDKE